ncbi:hypothetical protein E4T56_gene12723 [Termitomyces sp. T112]|nr:hypothetical protein E4T56_gene12723 [Termitomyces sp. T112]
MTLPPLQRRDPRDMGSESGIGRAWESKLINIDQTAASSGSVGKEVEGWTHPGVPQLVVMSSSAYSPTASRLPSPPSQPLSSKDSEGRQDHHRIKAMYRIHEVVRGRGRSLRAIVWRRRDAATSGRGPFYALQVWHLSGGGSACPRGFEGGTGRGDARAVCQGSGSGEGSREGAPSTQEKGKRRASPSPEAGPSKQARSEQVMGGPPGSAVYSPTSEAPVEQSADRSWLVVEAYLRHWVESLEWLLVAHEEEVQGVWEERDGARQELDRVRMEWDLAQKDKDIAVGTAMEQLSCLQELEVRMVHLQAQAEVVEVAMQQAGGSGAQETQQGSSTGEVWAAAERAWQWEKWLASEVALGQRGVLYWAREHCILLNGALAALGSIHDGLARMPGDLLPELGQGVTQMGHLLAGHRRRATADPKAWWEMATDVGELLPRQPEVLATVVAQLEVFMVGRVAGLGLEEEEE